LLPFQEYNTDIFDKATMERMMDTFIAILQVWLRVYLVGLADG
jgi:hypothetical protein